MTGGYDPGQWFGLGFVAGALVMWFVVGLYFITPRGPGRPAQHQHSWSNWYENLGAHAIDRRYRIYRMCDCGAVEVEGDVK